MPTRSRSRNGQLRGLDRLHGVDRVDRVAQAQLVVRVRVVVGAGVVAVVDVQHDEAASGQVVLLPREALAGDVDVGVDVAVVEHQHRVRALTGRHVHHPGQPQAVTAVADQVALVLAGAAELPPEPQAAAVVLLLDQRLHRDRVRLGRGLGRGRRRGGVWGVVADGAADRVGDAAEVATADGRCWTRRGAGAPDGSAVQPARTRPAMIKPSPRCRVMPRFCRAGSNPAATSRASPLGEVRTLPAEGGVVAMPRVHHGVVAEGVEDLLLQAVQQRREVLGRWVLPGPPGKRESPVNRCGTLPPS